MSKQTIALAYTRPADAPNEADYQALLEALSESARGRSFLAEHARRSRSTETNILLTAIERIEAQVRPRQPAPEVDLLHDELRGVLDDVRTARARIESGGAAPKAEQLAALLDILQRRLGKLLPPRPASDIPPPTTPETAAAARPAAARWLEEPLEPAPAVNDAKPPVPPSAAQASPPRLPPVATIKPSSSQAAPFEIEAEIKAVVAAEIESRSKGRHESATAAEADDAATLPSAEDALSAIMALTEDERMALFT